MQMKNQVGITVILASLILLGFVGCKKKEKDPDPQITLSTLPNGKVKIYSSESDWLNGVNVVKQGNTNSNGEFKFATDLPAGEYYYSVYTNDYDYHNDNHYMINNFTLYGGTGFGSSGSSTDPDDYHDTFRYRLAFLGDSVSTHWKLDESSNGGIHNSSCVSERRLKINRKYEFEITENGTCVSPSAYDYSIFFGENQLTPWGTTEITTFDIIHTGTTTGLYTLEVLEKVGGIATKIKLMQKATPANYEIYIKQ